MRRAGTIQKQHSAPSAAHLASLLPPDLLHSSVNDVSEARHPDDWVPPSRPRPGAARERCWPHTAAPMHARGTVRHRGVVLRRRDAWLM